MEMPIRVLVVDDEPDLLDIIVSCLKEAGFDVQGARTARTAMRQVETFHPDLLVSDVIMPDMNGFELAQAVQLKIPSLPIILISGNPDQAPPGNARNLCIHEIFPKPFALKDLIRCCLDATKQFKYRGWQNV